MKKTTQLLILALFSLLLSGCGGGGGRYYPMQTAVNTIGIEKNPLTKITLLFTLLKKKVTMSGGAGWNGEIKFSTEVAGILLLLIFWEKSIMYMILRG